MIYSRKRILFITPVAPNVNGGGKAKRAHQWLTLLERDHRVNILIINGNKEEQIAQQTDTHTISLRYSTCYKITRLVKTMRLILAGKPIDSGATIFGWLPVQKEHIHSLNNIYKSADFEKIICFRLYCSEFAEYIKQITGTNSIELDSDDLETETWGKLSDLFFKHKKYLNGWKYKLSSRQFQLMEHKLGRYDRVYVCSREDKAILSKRMAPSKISVFPNRVLTRYTTVPAAANLRSLLFVGTLDYFPNVHGILWFAENVFPFLKAANNDWVFNIVGYNASSVLKGKLAIDGIFLHNNLEDITEAYRNNSIVIAPLYAGGGTKLKVIEAMSFNRPVIATPEAVHGLGLVDNVHYILAQNATDFIQSCRNLSDDIELYKKLTLSAYDKISNEYSY